MSSWHFLAGVGIDLHVLDAMAGLLVELVEADLFGLGRRRIERDDLCREREMLRERAS